MQTPAEKRLIAVIDDYLSLQDRRDSLILNIGAGQSCVIEDALIQKHGAVMFDRVDTSDSEVERPNIRNSYIVAVEDMHLLESNRYDLSFANYVLEHVEDIQAAASEVSRILKPGGLFVTSLPNPTAIEFIIAKHTSLWIHRLVRAGESWKTHYSYKNIKHLETMLMKAGLRIDSTFYASFTQGYLERVFLLNKCAIGYDWTLNFLDVKRFMGNVCIVFKKIQQKRVIQ